MVAPVHHEHVVRDLTQVPVVVERLRLVEKPSYFAETSSASFLPSACRRRARIRAIGGEGFAVSLITALEVEVDAVVSVLAHQCLIARIDASRAVRIGENQMQGGRVLAVEARHHRDAAQLGPARDQRVVLAEHGVGVRLALEVGGIQGPDPAVVALEGLEALVGGGEHERVHLAVSGRRHCRLERRHRCRRAEVAPAVHGRDREAVIREGGEVADHRSRASASDAPGHRL